ncbi:glycoside hydrolase [Mycena albidolilacea]|uniref:Glycoside hydrolase n=1 Tax=Mycena albidolilacea TaxID=1033008 RepID=A0AAD7A098_9AGAR|nr:glycoside hydrolase [Mycena albidolilacea]
MHPSLFLLAVTALLGTCVQNVHSQVVFAHYMLGNINADHIAIDIHQARIAGIDGFSLNIGDPSQPFVLPVLTNLFAAAQAEGDFHLHISMDLYASGDAAGGHPGLYNALLKQFMVHPNYFHMNGSPLGSPYVTTFSDGGLQNFEWFNWKISIGTMYFCPNFDNTTGYTTGADGWWDYWGPIVDCVFTWDAAWPARPGEQGSVSQGSDEIDVAVHNAAMKRGKAYNMPLSTLQYKNSAHCARHGTNIYRPGDLNLVKRMENILRIQPDFVTIISWNDGPESHYIGDIWPKQNTDAEPARCVCAGTRWDHGGLRPLIKDFIDAYETQTTPYTGPESMPALSPSSVEGAMWYRTVTADSTCDASTYPSNAVAGAEVVNWAIVVGAFLTAVSIRITSGSTVTNYPISSFGFHYGSTAKKSGQQKIEVFSGGTLIAVGQGGRCVSAQCPDGIYNMNDIVVGVVNPSLAPPVSSCTTDVACPPPTPIGCPALQTPVIVRIIARRRNRPLIFIAL